MAVSLTSSGLAMPASQSASGDANTLDDYEEGTWTPGFIGNAGTAGSWADNAIVALYTKWGRIVNVQSRGYLTNLGSYSGTVQITGLPFTSTNCEAGGGLAMYPSSVMDGVYRGLKGPHQGTTMSIKSGSYLDSSAPWSEIATGRYFMFSLTYGT